jgi:hypothetical protein
VQFDRAQQYERGVGLDCFGYEDGAGGEATKRCYTETRSGVLGTRRAQVLDVHRLNNSEIAKLAQNWIAKLQSIARGVQSLTQENRLAIG